MPDLDFKSMTVSGFRSFRTDSTLDFPKESSGFYFLTGENKLHPNLGRNATGKSSIWEALVWVLYGRTSRGVRAGNVVNWEESDNVCSVRLTLAVDGVGYVLTRTQNPNSLSLRREDAEPVTVVQDDVLTLIGIDVECFLQSVVMGQFSRFFFDYSPTEKLSLFEKVMGLDRWVAHSQTAKDVRRSFQANLQAKEQDLSRIEGSISSLRALVKAKLSQAEGFAREKSEKLGRLQERRDGHGRKVIALDKTIDTLSADLAGELEDATELREELETEIGRISEEIVNLEKSLHASELESKRLAAEGLILRDSEGVCPSCRQTVPQDHIEREGQRIESVLIDNVKLVGAYKKQIRGLASTMGVAQARLVAVDQGIQTERDRREGVRRDCSKTEGDRRVAASELEGIRRSIRELEASDNLYEADVAKLQSQLHHLGVELADAKKDAKELAADEAACGFWVGGFKDLRLWLVRECLLEYEIEVNNSLLQLGLRGWSVSFDVERETKSGGVSKGFTVLVRAPGHDEFVPWEVWSGGETQRLRIAGSIGLSTLIHNRLGVYPNIEVWDEPTAHLSDEGVDDLTNFLCDRAKAIDKQVWLVDHRSLDFGGFTGQYVVTRDEFGSALGGNLDLTA